MKTDRVVELSRLGISADDITALGRIAGTLHRWAEQECGDGNNYASWAIVRDDETNIPYREIHPHTGKSYRTRIADRETGALKRLAAIMARYPDLIAYHQGDPRGASLYIISRAEIGDRNPDSYYSSYGTAVY